MMVLNGNTALLKWVFVNTLFLQVLLLDLCFILICLMMTSSNGSIFRVTGHLWGEFTSHRWIPLTRASDAELWCFLWSAPTNVWTNNWDTSVLRRHRVHYDVTVMLHTKSLSPNFHTPGTEIKRRNCRPSGHYWNHSMRTLSNCSNCCFSFEGREPVNEIYRDRMTSNDFNKMIKHGNRSPCNDHMGSLLLT